MDILVYGTLLFWTAIIVMSGLIIWGLEKDSGPGTTFAFVGSGLAIWYLTGAIKPDWGWLLANWINIIAYIAGYIVIGVIYSAVKWLFVLHNAADEVQSRISSITAEWERSKVRGYQGTLQQFIVDEHSPKPQYDDFAMWIIWWPWSGAWTLVNDPLKRIIRFVYENMASLYTKMSRAVFASRFKGLG